MGNFKVIYRILKALEAAPDCESFDAEEQISAERLGVTKPRLYALFSMLSQEGYITGVRERRFPGEQYPQADIRDIRITLKGLEYLSENSLMKKAACLLKEVSGLVKP